jgi:hypothetical protein
MKKLIIPFILLAAFLTSCEDVIDIELSSEDKGFYAIEAKITTLDEPTVRLSKAQPVSAEQNVLAVSEAHVTVRDNATPANIVILVESSETKGLYIVPEGIDYYGNTNREYTVTIETGDVTMTASDFLYPVEPIDSIRVWPSMRGDKRFLGIFTYGWEKPGLGDYYKWDIFINDTLLNQAEYIFIADDALVDGNYVDGLEIFTDFTPPHSDIESQLKYMDVVQVKQQSLSQFGFEYYYQVLNQSFGGNMFSVPPANIPGNFTSSDGKEVLGFFVAQDVSVSNAVVVDDYVMSELRD